MVSKSSLSVGQHGWPAWLHIVDDNVHCLVLHVCEHSLRMPLAQAWYVHAAQMYVAIVIVFAPRRCP
jgi:hypothetical protein